MTAGLRFELLHDVCSRGAELSVSSAWVRTECVFSGDQFNTADGRLLGDQMFYTDNAPAVEQKIPVTGTIADMAVQLGVWSRVAAGQATAGAYLSVFDPSTAQVSSVALTLVQSLTLQRLNHVFSDNLLDTSFYVRIGGATTASGDTMDLARAHVAVGSGLIQIFPETDYERRDQKLEDEHRGRTGKRFVYKWGQFWSAQFGIRFVNSFQQAVINSWWSSNAKLLWMVDTGTEVESVQLVGERLPVARFATPNLTEYSGLIRLETY